MLPDCGTSSVSSLLFFISVNGSEYSELSDIQPFRKNYVLLETESP